MIILHADSNHPTLIQQLEAAGHHNIEAYNQTKEEILENQHLYDGIVIRSRFKIEKDFFDAAPGLKFIARVGAGLESIDVEYAKQKGVALFSAPEGNRNAVGEHALGMLLSLFNKLNQADRQVREGFWYREANRGVELDGKTVGIIGYGNMGKSFAKKLQGFDVEVICYDILEGVGDKFARQVSLNELQEKADVLSLHTPWTSETNQMINSAFIKAFKKPFWFLNTARGKSVVTADLVEALQLGKILGAGLDVLEYEKSSFENFFTDDEIPQALKDLLVMENVLLSPHVAGWTVESHRKLADTIAQKIIMHFEDEKEEAQEATGSFPSRSDSGLKKKVTGIGGVFFKTKDPEATRNWYNKHLGLNTDQWGSTFWWKDKEGNDCSTQWSPMKEDTDYYQPSGKEFMLNYRVENLEELLKELKEEGVKIVGKMQTFDYGKFGWIMDLDGNKIELWEPLDKAFL